MQFVSFLAEPCFDGPMAKPTYIELADETRIPILYEDRTVMALDKPAGWILGPDDWDHAARNLPLAIQSSISAGDYWARSRNMRYLRHVHRLDAGTSGILLCVKHLGAMAPISRLFADRVVKKTYLAVTDGLPKQPEWTRTDMLGPEEREPGRHRVDPTAGKEAQTDFKVLQTGRYTALVEAKPHTGRTHQIRLHLAASGTPVQGDTMYGTPHPGGLALRAVGLEYTDPFTQRVVRISAPAADFCRHFGFTLPERPRRPAAADPEAGTPPPAGTARPGPAPVLAPVAGQATPRISPPGRRAGFSTKS